MRIGTFTAAHKHEAKYDKHNTSYHEGVIATIEKKILVAQRLLMTYYTCSFLTAFILYRFWFCCCRHIYKDCMLKLRKTGLIKVIHVHF